DPQGRRADQLLNACFGKLLRGRLLRGCCRGHTAQPQGGHQNPDAVTCHLRVLLAETAYRPVCGRPLVSGGPLGSGGGPAGRGLSRRYCAKTALNLTFCLGVKTCRIWSSISVRDLFRVPRTTSTLS